MTEEDVINFNNAYLQIMSQQTFETEKLDYSVIDRHAPVLHSIARISNSVVSVFDFSKKQHVFNSSNLGEILGYTPEQVRASGNQFIDSKIHPEDFGMLAQIGLSTFKLFFSFSEDEKLNHKLVSEFRILNAAGKYIRVIEQQQVLELDHLGNLWLALSILDISPNQQNLNEGLKSELINFRTGKIILINRMPDELTVQLTRREKEILNLVKSGLLSKEISDKLAISLHTVNTYRQKVIGKLGVNNSMEAVMLATRLGLI